MTTATLKFRPGAKEPGDLDNLQELMGDTVNFINDHTRHSAGLVSVSEGLGYLISISANSEWNGDPEDSEFWNMVSKITDHINDHTIHQVSVVDKSELKPDPVECEWWVKETIIYLITAYNEDQALEIWRNEDNKNKFESSREVEVGFEI